MTIPEREEEPVAIASPIPIEIQQKKVQQDNGRWEGRRNSKGEREGKGTYVWPTGKMYVGCWDNDMMNDEEGVMTWMDGKRYEGCFVDDKREGKGISTKKDGRKYEGNWKNDKPNGLGEEKWPDGKKYEGEFVDG